MRRLSVRGTSTCCMSPTRRKRPSRTSRAALPDRVELVWNVKYCRACAKADSSDANQLRPLLTVVCRESCCVDVRLSFQGGLRLRGAGSFDRFHIVAKMNKALDEVRAAESRQMAREGHEPLLKKSRWCVLKRKENLTWHGPPHSSQSVSAGERQQNQRKLLTSTTSRIDT
jgi:hypothetical protein